MQTLHSWLQSKLARPFRCLSSEVRATEEWKRFTGRGHYAKLTLVGHPAEAFSLVSAPDAWRTEAERAEYEPYVLDGVLSELLGGPSEPVLGIQVVVEAAVTHEVESNGNAFFQAAKMATQKLLAGPGGLYRDNCTNGG
jgi:translation elongation factor EF-G